MQQFNQAIMIMVENILVIRDPKTFHFEFNWHKDIDENLKHEIRFTIKINKSLAENEIKNEIEQLLSKILMITKYSKTNEPHKFVLNFS